MWNLSLFLFLCSAAAAAPREILLEAEVFSKYGGWVLDQQSMVVMGSSYLMAHGMGEPVADAATEFNAPEGGAWDLWVRTRDWVPKFGPGKFQVLINGSAVPRVFGADGDGKWAWHRGGSVQLQAGANALALRDLTGFNGRADAILFVRGAAAGYAPPNESKSMYGWRKRLLHLPAQPGDAGEYDLVVVGGGLAGIGASVSAARLGMRVALIHDRPVLGGNASGEIGVPPIGKLDFHLFPRNADVVIDIKPGDDKRQEEIVRSEKTLSLFLNMRGYGVEKKGERIAAVLARDIRTAGEKRFRAPLFVDTTGDGDIGALAGAEFRMGREARSQTGETFAPDRADNFILGNTNYWRAKPTAEPTSFPACPWAVQVNEQTYDVPWGKAVSKNTSSGLITRSSWNWESGYKKNAITQAEEIRDYNLRAIYGVWDFLKNRSAKKVDAAKWKLEWVGYVLGKRESRRLIGDYVVTQQDLEENVQHKDGCVIATWYIDLHYPHPEQTKHFPDGEFRSIALDDPNYEKYKDQLLGREVQIKPFPIPYRAFYSKNVPNLFMAGRNISVTHVALGSVRVMKTTTMMGTVVGRTAYLCHRIGCEPREIYTKHLDELKAFLKNPAPR